MAKETNKTWTVRAAIPGKFIEKEKFTSKRRAMAYYKKLEIQGIWEELDIF